MNTLKPKTVHVNINADIILDKNITTLFDSILQLENAVEKVKEEVRNSKVLEEVAFENDSDDSASIIIEKKRKRDNKRLRFHNDNGIWIPMNGPTTKPKPKPTQKPERNGLFTAFILDVLKHFVIYDYMESRAYSWVFRDMISNNNVFIYNKSEIHYLGEPFLKLMKGANNYLVTLAPHMIQGRVAEVYLLMSRRRLRFTNEFNLFLDYVDSIYNATVDKPAMSHTLRNLRNPKQNRYELAKYFGKKVINEPFKRLPVHEKRRFGKKLSEIITKSRFNKAFNGYYYRAETDTDSGETLNTSNDSGQSKLLYTL